MKKIQASAAGDQVQNQQVAVETAAESNAELQNGGNQKRQRRKPRSRIQKTPGRFNPAGRCENQTAELKKSRTSNQSRERRNDRRQVPGGKPWQVYAVKRTAETAGRTATKKCRHSVVAGRQNRSSSRRAGGRNGGERTAERHGMAGNGGRTHGRNRQVVGRTVADHAVMAEPRRHVATQAGRQAGAASAGTVCATDPERR